MNRLTIALCVLTVTTVGALADTSCGWPILGGWHSGGQCLFDGWGNWYCTQPHEVTPPKCEGLNNPKKCSIATGTIEVTHFIPMYANMDCRTGGCIDSGQKELVTYHEFTNQEQNCQPDSGPE